MCIRDSSGPLAKIAPNLRSFSPVTKKNISTDKSVGEDYFKDPLVFRSLTFRLGYAITQVQDFVNEHTPDLLIHGHTHRPNIHKVSDSIRIVLGDWGDYGWFLSINDKDYKLEKFSIS